MWKDDFERNISEIRYNGTKEGQEKRLEESRESAQAVLFKIRQLEAVIALRNTELSGLKESFAEFSELEIAEAESNQANFPLSQPAPMQYGEARDQNPRGTIDNGSGSGSGSSGKTE